MAKPPVVSAGTSSSHVDLDGVLYQQLRLTYIIYFDLESNHLDMRVYSLNRRVLFCTECETYLLCYSTTVCGGGGGVLTNDAHLKALMPHLSASWICDILYIADEKFQIGELTLKLLCITLYVVYGKTISDDSLCMYVYMCIICVSNWSLLEVLHVHMHFFWLNNWLDQFDRLLSQRVNFLAKRVSLNSMKFPYGYVPGECWPRSIVGRGDPVAAV